MTTLARWLAMVCALAILAATPLRAAEPKSPAAPAVTTAIPDMAGHYYLEGIMETGSELVLGSDGKFQWYFSYGALDLEAQGRWQREGDRIVLLPDTFHFPPQYPETEFKRMQLRIEDGDLIPAWPWEGGTERGRYTRE